MIADLHVHTEFSCDSEADMEQYVKRAINKKMHTICFTEHVDLNQNDYGYNYYRPEHFFEKFNQIKEKYHNFIDVYAGIEFGEPHLYAGKLKQLSIKEIFKLLLDKNMVIEINTSSLRKGHSEAMPGRELLEIYKDCGGAYVTVGSDAHEIKDIAADNNFARKLIKDFALQEVIYEHRNRIILKKVL